MKSAEDTVREALVAHALGKWEQLVSLIDAVSLDEWREGWVHANTHVRSLNEWREEFPKAPLANVERIAEEMARPKRAFVANLSTHIAGIESLEQLATLSSREVLIRVLQANDPIDAYNRFMAAACTAAGVQQPAGGRRTRPMRYFRITGREDISEARVRIAFCEEGATTGDAWMLVREASGDWRIMMTSEVVHLPGGFVIYVDDPVLLPRDRRLSN